MFFIYSMNSGEIYAISADAAQYAAGTRDAIVSGASVCIWMVPGTVEGIDR